VWREYKCRVCSVATMVKRRSDGTKEVGSWKWKLRIRGKERMMNDE
jgi:hypothetical protein